MKHYQNTDIYYNLLSSSFRLLLISSGVLLLFLIPAVEPLGSWGGSSNACACCATSRDWECCDICMNHPASTVPYYGKRSSYASFARQTRRSGCSCCRTFRLSECCNMCYRYSVRGKRNFSSGQGDVSPIDSGLTVLSGNCLCCTETGNQWCCNGCEKK